MLNQGRDAVQNPPDSGRERQATDPALTSAAGLAPSFGSTPTPFWRRSLRASSTGPLKTALTRQQVFPCHDAPFGHHSTYPPGDGSKRAHSCDRPRCVFGQFVERADLRGRGPSRHERSHAGDNRLTPGIVIGQPLDIPCRFVDARAARRGCRSSGARVRDGRTRREGSTLIRSS